MDIMARRAAKKGDEPFPVVVRKRKTYVFFTWVGLFHWLFLISVAAVAFNYTNNVSIVMICFLASMFLMGLFRNHALLRKLTLQSITARPVEEGQSIIIRASLNHPPFPSLPGVYVRVFNVSEMMETEGRLSHATLTLPSLPFGLYQLPPVVLFSLWPYGLERTWVALRPRVLVAVLPHQENAAPQDHLARMGWDALHEARIGDPDGIRPLADTERGKIAWRDTLRRGKRMTYTYVSSSPDTVTWAWPEDERPPEEKIKEAKALWEHCLKNQAGFRVVHPSFTSLPARDRVTAFALFERLMLLEMSPQPWPHPHIPAQKNSLQRFFGSFFS